MGYKSTAMMKNNFKFSVRQNSGCDGNFEMGHPGSQKLGEDPWRNFRETKNVDRQVHLARGCLRQGLVENV
jgi:hypothetical protein